MLQKKLITFLTIEYYYAFISIIAFVLTDLIMEINLL